MGSHVCPLRRRALCAALLLAFAAPASAVDLVWSAGTFPGGVVPAPEHGGQLSLGEVLQINAGGNKFFNSPLVTLPGSLVFWNADTLYLQHGTAILNQSAWHAHGDNTLSFNSGGNTALAYPSFTNQGLFLKAGGTGTTTIGAIVFDNHAGGIVQADMGTILFAGHSSIFRDGSTFAGAGTIAVNSNAAFIGGFGSSNLELRAGGEFTGSNATLQAGTARFTGGVMLGTWNVAAGQSFAVGSGGDKFLGGSVATELTNAGALRWQTTQSLHMRNGAVLRNQGAFDIEADMSISFNAGPATPQFINTGTVRARSGATGTVPNTVLFVNNGGVLHAEDGAMLSFSGGNAVFNDGSTFAGPGVVRANHHAWFSGALTSENLSLQGAGTYTGGNAVVNGNLEFQAGVLAGTWTLAEDATLFARTTGNKFLDGPDTSAGPGTPETRFTNLGTVRWQAAVPLYMRDGAVLDNRGTFAFEENGSLSLNALSARFENRGTLRVEAGRSATVAGVLNFQNHGGELRAEDGATLTFAGGNAHFNDGTRFTGPGVVRAIHNASFNGAIASDNLSLQSIGIYTGGNAVVNGEVEFQAGVLAGTWTLAEDATLFARTTGNKFLDGPDAAGGPVTRFTNLGTVRWQAAAPLHMRDNAVFDNRGTFAFEANGSLSLNAVGATFDNSGTLRVEAGHAAAVSGVLNFRNSGGELRAEDGATLTFQGGNAHFRDETRFSGAGRVLMTHHGSFTGDIHSANLELNAGQLTGGGVDGAARLHGMTKFAGGSLLGTWELGADHTLAVTAGTMFLDGGSVTNHGRIDITTASPLRLAANAQFTNHGTIDLQSTGGAVNQSGGVFVNRGLIQKVAGGGTATIGDGINFDNRGVVDASSGTIMLPSNFVNNGTLTGSASFDAANNVLFNSGHVAPGNSPGTLTIAANFTQTANGVLDIELADLSAYDRLIVQGTATLGGTLALSCVLGCGVEDGDVYTILDATGNLTGTFASVTTAGFGEGFAYQVIYDAANDWVQLAVIDAGVLAPIPEPETYALVLAGLGLLGFVARRRAAKPSRPRPARSRA